MFRNEHEIHRFYDSVISRRCIKYWGYVESEYMEGEYMIDREGRWRKWSWTILNHTISYKRRTLYSIYNQQHTRRLQKPFITDKIYDSQYSDQTTVSTTGIRFSAGTQDGFLPSPSRPDCLFCPLSLLFSGYRGLFPQGKAIGTWSWPLTST